VTGAMAASAAKHAVELSGEQQQLHASLLEAKDLAEQELASQQARASQEMRAARDVAAAAAEDHALGMTAIKGDLEAARSEAVRLRAEPEPSGSTAAPSLAPPAAPPTARSDPSSPTVAGRARALSRASRAGCPIDPTVPPPRLARAASRFLLSASAYAFRRSASAVNAASTGDADPMIADDPEPVTPSPSADSRSPSCPRTADSSAWAVAWSASSPSRCRSSAASVARFRCSSAAAADPGSSPSSR
jgi:hypothetical protein